MAGTPSVRGGEVDAATELMTARLARPNDTSTSSSLIHLATQGLDALDGYFAKYLPRGDGRVHPALMLAVVLGQDWVSARSSPLPCR